MIAAYLAYQFAGLWALLWHFGALGVGAVGCFAASYFSPVFKKDFLWAGVSLVAVIATLAVGVNLGEKRVQAQWDVAKANSTAVGKKARADAVRDVARNKSRGVSNKRDIDLRD